MNTIINKIALPALVLLILAGCGGGGGGNAPISQPSSVIVLQSLSNSQGIARITGPKYGFIYSPQITAITKSMNESLAKSDSSGIVNLNAGNFPIVSTTATTVTRRGTITEDGTALNVTALQNNNTSDAAGLYIEVPGDADILMVAGESPSLIPSSGSIIYTGVFTQNARSIIAPGQIGSFNLTIDYSLKKFTMRGTTSSMTLNCSGVIDINTGLYASSTAVISVNGLPYTASLYGNINGAGAKTVSGIFYTNDSTPDFAGTFIGSQ